MNLYRYSPNIVASAFLILASCITHTSVEQRDYELVWSDEFDGDSIQTSVWNFWEGTAYNNELQYYTPRAENAYVRNGNLYLEARRENYKGRSYTSARISTDSTKIGWKYGRFEARMKMPEGRGFWPAFWLMPMRDDSWPRGGEIDIMEYRGNDTRTTTGAVHYWMKGCEGNPVECRNYLTDSYTKQEGTLSETFHVYALEWTEKEITWYLDDVEFMHVGLDEVDTEFDPFSTPFYIILNLAVGGDFLPDPDETTEFPQALVVDYVRVYQKAD